MNVKIMGADDSVTNVSNDHYTANVQVFTGRGHLYKLTFSPTATSVDTWAWIFDRASASVMTNPVAVRFIPAGYADTWDFGPDGSLFKLGLGVRLATAPPTDPTTDAAA